MSFYYIYEVIYCDEFSFNKVHKGTDVFEALFAINVSVFLTLFTFGNSMVYHMFGGRFIGLDIPRAYPDSWS